MMVSTIMPKPVANFKTGIDCDLPYVPPCGIAGNGTTGLTLETFLGSARYIICRGFNPKKETVKCRNIV
jgi:hypothetical protein